MLTIFTTPKSFSGHIKTIQTNAVLSWKALQPSCEVILFGNEDGTAEISRKLSIKQVAEVECNEYGTPLVSSMFKIAQDVAANKLLCYINADIILMSDFITAVRRISKDRFLMVGRRWDIDLDELIEFQKPDWEEGLKSRVAREGRLHSVTGIDYFVFPKGLYDNIPTLAVGRPGWDNWMIYHTRSRKIPVIEATGAVMAVHQEHRHSDHPGGEEGFWQGPEAKRNIELAGGIDHAFHIGFTDWTLTGKGLRPARSCYSLYFKWRALPVLNPGFRFLLPLVKLPGKIAAAFKRGR